MAFCSWVANESLGLFKENPNMDYPTMKIVSWRGMGLQLLHMFVRKAKIYLKNRGREACRILSQAS